MDSSAPENSESEDPLDQLIGEYLQRIDREGLQQQSGIRAALLRNHPAFQSQLSSYFAEEDRVTGAMGQLLADSRGETPARVLRYIGEYELLDLLGRGGMGDVYRARQSKTGRIVAVKVMRLSAPHERFRREIEIVSSLRHPNIVTLFEADEDHDQQFYSMEFVAGGSLADRTNMSPRAVALLGVKVARALDYAHQQNVLHRDIKPDNILIDENDEPLIADFGLAKLTEATDVMTTTQDVVGTFAYMSPEQARGENAALTPASDVYSLGATLYQSLCGHPPIQGPNTAELIRNVQIQEVVSPRVFNSAVPVDLSNILLKCLQKERQDRYRSASDFADHLQLFLEGKPVPVRPVSTTTRILRWIKREPRLASLTIVTLLSIILGGITSIAFGLRAEREAALATSAATSLKAAEGELKRELHFSRLLVANSYWADGNVEDARRLLRESIPSSPDEVDFRDIEWYLLWQQCHSGRLLDRSLGRDAILCASSDGSRIAVGKRDAIEIWETQNWTKEFTLGTPGEQFGKLRGLAFYDSDRKLVSVHSSPWVRTWDLAEQKVSGVIPALPSDSTTTAMALSPDGKQLAVVVATKSADHECLFVDLTETQITSRRKLDFGTVSVAISPDMSRVAFGGYHAWEVQEFTSGTKVVSGGVYTAEAYGLQFDVTGQSLLWINEGAVHMTDIMNQRRLFTQRGHAGDITTIEQVILTPDRRYLFATGGADGTVKLWNYNGNELRLQFRGHSETVVSIVQIPGTSQLLSASQDGTLRLWDLDDDHEVVGPLISNVSFSDDQRWRCVSTSANEIFLADAATNTTHRLHDGHDEWRAATISPSGQWVASTIRDGHFSVWDSSTQTLLATHEFPHALFYAPPQFLPDGKRLVIPLHILSTHPEYQLYKQDKAFPNLVIWDCISNTIERTLTKPQWGSFALCISNQGVIATRNYRVVDLVDSTTGAHLAELEDSFGGALAFSPDGQYFVTASDRLFVHDGKTFQLLSQAKGYGGTIEFVTFLPDGSRLLSAGSDGRVVIWETSNWQPLLSLRESDAPLIHVGITPDRRRLFSTRPWRLDFWPIADEAAVSENLRRGW